MKVLWVHNFDLNIQNSGVFMVNAAKELQDKGYNIDLFYTGNLRNPLNILKCQKTIKDKAKNYDIVHAQYGSACALTTLRVRNCATIVTLRGSDWNAIPTSSRLFNIHKKMAVMFTKASLKYYDIIVTVSERMAEEVRKNYKEKEIFSLPSPIDLKRFLPINKDTAKEKLGFKNNNEKWVLFTTISKTNATKRYDLAKQAFDIAQKRNENIRFKVASGIPHESMPSFVSACDVILCTSISEGWPNSIKEALACNIPFVSTDVSDLKEIALKEKSCKVVQSINPHVIADALCEVLNQNEPANLRQYVEEMNMNNFTKNLISIYKTAISKFKNNK